MADQYSAIIASDNYKKFVSSLSTVTLDDITLAKQYMNIDYNLNKLKEISKYYKDKTINGHYSKCVWSNPRVQDGPDTCVCDTIARTSHLIYTSLQYLFGGDSDRKV